jgi:hypothetical protein
MILLCKNKNVIIDRINKSTALFKQQPPSQTPKVCELIKSETTRYIALITETKADHMGIPTQTQKNLIIDIINLYLAKYISVYCTGASFNIDLMQRQLLNAVEDICSVNSDLKLVIITNLEYTIMKPLSIMSS